MSHLTAQLSSRRKAIVLLAAALIVLLALTERSALQLVAALATCLVLPGLGWARKLRAGDRGDTFAMTLVISISVTVLVSTAMAVSAHWSVAGGLAALAAVTLLGFVPYRALAAKLPVVAWYDDSRRRAAEQRAVARRAAAEDSERWQDWYAGRSAEADLPEPEAVDLEPVLIAAPTAEPVEDADLAGLGNSWDDWYAAARRRDDAARRQQESNDRRSGVEWREWYRRAANDAPAKRDPDA